MTWQLIRSALEIIGFRRNAKPTQRVYEGVREREGEEAKRYLEQANRSLAKLQKRLDEKMHECA